MNSYGSYKKARNASWQIMIDYKINSLPVDVVALATKAGILIVKNKDVDELNDNESGVSFYDGSQWYIIYDETMFKERIRFTIAHEIGHIFLGHPLIAGVNARRIFDENKPAIEREADIFASRLLAPACVLRALQLNTVEEIMTYCQISRKAAEIRLKRMQELYKKNMFLKSSLEKQVFNQFQDFIAKYKV